MRRAFTLVEVLIATALTLIIMGVTVTLFANITGRISASRAIIETNDRLRATRDRLIPDLRGITAPTLPPLRPEAGLGYFEYVEGTWAAPAVQDDLTTTDTTSGDTDDVLMFTTRTSREPFVGRNGGTNALSQMAEVAWFVRGTTLYRRVLLVLPSQNPVTQTGFYGDYDISVRQVGGPQDPAAVGGQPILVANTLGDLTKRENRYGHQPRKMANGAIANDPFCGYPHSIGRWGQLGLPTLRECSDSAWPFPWYQSAGPVAVAITGVPAGGFAGAVSLDYWNSPYGNGLDTQTGTLTGYMNGTRIAEDVILTNVISFDVRAYDPGAPLFLSGGNALEPGDSAYAALFKSWATSGNGADGYGAYVNLNYTRGMGLTIAEQGGAEAMSPFSGPGHYRDFAVGPVLPAPVVYYPTARSLPAVYCTWSTHYESDGLNQDPQRYVDFNGNGSLADAGDSVTNSTVDDATDGMGPDDASELESPPPYATPLRGIQVKIRVFEPDSRQIREVTIRQDFLPE